jgi:hypothetical protein
MSDMNDMSQQVEPPQPPPPGLRAPFAALNVAEARELAEEAFIFGYPLVLMDVTREVMTATERPEELGAPVNQFAHMRAFPDPSFTAVVSPNADTLYSSAWLDVSREPVVLSLPDMNGRYYMVQIVDGWTNVIAAPGTRTTGAGAGNYTITWPGWRGTLPAGMRMVAAPTAMVWLIGRVKTNGASDYAAVRTMQDRFRLTPLSAWGTPYTPPDHVPVAANVNRWEPPVDQVARMDAMTFFSRLNALLVTNPPATGDMAMMERIGRVGIAPGVGVDHARLDEVIAGAMSEGMETARAKIATVERAGGDILVNGWAIPSGLGRYGTSYLKRAAVALVGLGANLPEDTVYPRATMDRDNEPLTGQRRYTIFFDRGEAPPVNGFWSLTMYNERQVFVENSINRYAIGDRDSLRYNEDGSLMLYIQHDSPGAERESNWLPAPEGLFNLMLRLYWPKPAILDGEWAPPPIHRVG